MSHSSTDETFENRIKNLQSNFSQILTSDGHYNTPEITKHIQYINNALDNIKLDYEFRRGSKDWIKQLDADEMKSNERNVEQLVAEGNNLVRQLNIRLHAEMLKDKEQNQIREIDNWACGSLMKYLQALQPYASSSYARLDNMAHHLGVTDRFVGYRNNLTRFRNQPSNGHRIRADRKLPPISTPNGRDWTHTLQHPGLSITSILRPPSNDHRNTFSSMATTHPIETLRPNTSRKTAIRSFTYTNDYATQLNRAGIPIKYPGASETLDRFTKPQESFYSPSLAVAQPDYTRIGRPLARLISTSSCSEYIDRYTFPKASKIQRYPWLRP